MIIEEGRAARMGELRNACILPRNVEGEEALGRPTCRCKGNIKSIAN
jgi:hypothetical protein